MKKVNKFLGVALLSALAITSVAFATSCNKKKPTPPPHEHTYSDTWSKNETQHWKDATCAHTGEKSELANHTYNNGVVTKPATETEKGVKTYTCTACGYSYTEDLPMNSKSYNVSVKSISGAPLSGVMFEVYSGSIFYKELTTDSKGTASLELVASNEYTINITYAPLGYIYEESYDLNKAGTTEITLESRVITTESVPSDHNYKLGDIMYDFEILDANKNPVKLSEILEEKDAVHLNFFYVGCDPCNEEFPFINAAYNTYKNSVEVVSCSIHLNDNVSAYQTSMGLDFTMGVDSNYLFANFNTYLENKYGQVGVPVNIMIDRYGVISMIDMGGIPEEKVFALLYDIYSGNGYTPRIIEDINELGQFSTPTVENQSSEVINAAIAKEPATFLGSHNDVADEWLPYPEGLSDSQYAWPFNTTTKDGENCVYATNKGTDNSFSYLRLKKYFNNDEGIKFEYLVSAEYNATLQSGDSFVVTVTDDLGNISYVVQTFDTNSTWKNGYYIVPSAGWYEFGFCYVKDLLTSVGDDTAYVKNVKLITSADLADETDEIYIMRNAATGDNYDVYVPVILNPEDGYYHVNTIDGPLLLADISGLTHWDPNKSIYDVAGSNQVIQNASVDQSCTNIGLTSVTEQLANALKAASRSHLGNENAWLRACKYVEPYGSATNLPDPCAGLREWNAFTAVQFEEDGVTLHHNEVNVDRYISLPGFMYKFTPTESGVYRFRTTGRPIYETTIELNGQGGTLVPAQDGVDYKNNTQLTIRLTKGVTYYPTFNFYASEVLGTFSFVIEYIGTEYRELQSVTNGPTSTFSLYDINLQTGFNNYNYFPADIDVIYLDPNEEYTYDGKKQKGDGYYHVATYRYQYQNAPKLDAQGNKMRDTSGNVIYWTKDIFDPENDPNQQYAAAVNDYAWNGNIMQCYVRDGKDGLFGNPVKTLASIGRILYLDVTGTTFLFPNNSLYYIIENGGFNFKMTSQTEINPDTGKLELIPNYLYQRDQQGNFIYDENTGKKLPVIGTDGKPVILGEDLTDRATEVILFGYYDDDGDNPPPTPELWGTIPVSKEVAELMTKLTQKYDYGETSIAWVFMCYSFFDY